MALSLYPRALSIVICSNPNVKLFFSILVHFNLFSKRALLYRLMVADSKLLLFCLPLIRVKREQCLQKYISTVWRNQLPVVREYRKTDETIDQLSPLKRAEDCAIFRRLISSTLSFQQPNIS